MSGNETKSAVAEILTFRTLVKAALAVLAEYAVLSLIEDAPLSVKIATALIPALALLVIEFDRRLNAWHTNIVPASLGALVAAYIAILILGPWVRWHATSHNTSRRGEIREQLALYIGQAEAMQKTCEDPRSTVPDVGQWKGQVEQFLATVSPEYVIRFREGVSDMAIGGVDAAHQACWEDLHVRERNLERFFDDFRSSSD